MARAFILYALLFSAVESCLLPESRYVIVPREIAAGYKVTTVNLDRCDVKSVRTDDPSFSVRSNGDMVAAAPVSVLAKRRTITVKAVEAVGGTTVYAHVHLVHNGLPSPPRPAGQKGFLKRTKRRWSPPPFNILENDAGPFPRKIERIVSDSEAQRDVYYTMTGPGYNRDPVGVFGFDSNTGMLSLLKPVDREEYPEFVLITNVYDRITNQPTDLPLDIKVKVDDVNDNAPQFVGPLRFMVPEKSKAGTVVGKVNATDRDQANTDHVKIRYSLLTGTDLFSIDPKTGVIKTKTANLDREAQERHLVQIQIKDMDGAASGLATTGTATIALSDVNDNPPTFTQTKFSATVMENESNKLILRIPVEDKDVKNTPNWIAKYMITKGNENGNFRIETDPNTNDGLLYVAKPLDFEMMQNVQVEVMAQNEAELSGTTATWASVPIDVTVTNVDEGPQFSAPTYRLKVKENTPNGTVIGKYQAIDPETNSGDGIRYYKVSDPGNWVNVDRNTGELKVANTFDRESPLVTDGIYNITMKAVDASSKTGTGTVIIQVEDVNDNAPALPSAEQVVCEKEGEMGSVVVAAQDGDQPPFGSPFTFSLPKDNDGRWTINRFNDTATTLKHTKELPTGVYDVPLYVTDLQGFGKMQTAKVRICQCRAGVCLSQPRQVEYGPLGILTMLLPLALLLLLFLLLIFFCATKREKLQLEEVGDSGGILLKSNTEAPGEEVDSSLINFPAINTDQVVKGSVKDGMLNSGWQGNRSFVSAGGQDAFEAGGVGIGGGGGSIYKSGFVTSDGQEMFGHYDSQYGTQQLQNNSGVSFDRRHFHDAALHHTWQTNGRYLQQKLGVFGAEGDGRYADDIIHSYGYEGAGSAAGSVGCCSDHGDPENLDFLNTLGPKFKTLAGVCRKS